MLRNLIGRLGVLPSWRSKESPTRRQFVLRGVMVGFCVSVAARIWMRTISEERVFTVVGTGLIFFVFTGMGVLAALAAWWRKNPERPRRIAIRAAGFTPYVLLGPFMLFFVPSVLAAIVTGHPAWRQWKRRVLLAVSIVFFGLIELVLLTADVPGGPMLRLVSGILYLPLAYALFISVRLAWDPLPSRSPVAAAG